MSSAWGWVFTLEFDKRVADMLREYHAPRGGGSMTDLPIHPDLGDSFTYEDALRVLALAVLGDDPDSRLASPRAKEIAQAVLQVGLLLIEKNAAYGDSALSPVSVFSKAGVIDRLDIRIDDKLSRLARGHDAGEDTEIDLIGYLILRRIAKAQLSQLKEAT